MTTANYHRALFEADQDLARCLVQRQKIDHKVARLQAVITQLQDLCAEMDHKNFERRVERVVKADLKMGITELARVNLKEMAVARNWRSPVPRNMRICSRKSYTIARHRILLTFNASWTSMV